MAQQNTPSQPLDTEGEVRFPTSLPEDSEYIMAPQGGAPQNGRWVYGPPDRALSDRQMESGAPGFLVTEPRDDMENETMPMPIQGMNGGFGAPGPSRDFGRSQRMRNPLDMEATHMPADSREAYLASMRSLLNRNVGYFVVCTFQIGAQPPVTWQGILHTVGSDYLVLYQPDYERYVSCDLYSLKFTQFHNMRGVPYCAAARSWEGR